MAVSHKLHQSIGGLSYATSQTITAASRASADPTGMDGYWIDRALEQVAEHRRVLDTLDAELRDLMAPAEVAA